MKLNPPLLGLTVPAFYGDTIKIPFEMNPTILKEQVGGFSIKISNILSTGDNITIEVRNDKEIISALETGTLIATVSNLKQTNSGYVQLAYIDNSNTTGYYSTAAIVKYTTEPNVNIKFSTNHKSFIGEYKTEDLNEYLYKYRFIIKDQNGNIFDDSDWLVHDSTYDKIENNEYIATNTYIVNKEYNHTLNYIAEYQVLSVNNLQMSVVTESFIDECVLSPSTDLLLILNYDCENACVNISTNLLSEQISPGTYRIVRSDSKTDYQIWTPLKNYQLATNLTYFKYKDCTVEQGVSYKYGYQQYNKHGVYSDIWGIVELKDVDFEHMYLGDKDRLIKLAFNPKVSGFKDNILEQKQDTIGGKYPYFFRNGNVDYKEFSISGLLSYHLDEDEFFMIREKLGLEKFLEQRDHTNSYRTGDFKLPTTNQVGYNVYAEREFRNALLDWLNNGEEKLFRSPTEGNYVVRLSEVNLSANEQLSRLVSEFSATVTEIGSADIGDIVAAGRLIDTSEHDGKIYQAGSENVENMIEKTETVVTYTQLTIQEMHMLDNTGGESMIDDALDMFDVLLLININNDSPNYPAGTKTIVLNNIQSCTNSNYESFSNIESYINYIKSFAYFGGDMPIVYKKTSELITTPAKVINLSSQDSKFEYINITGAFPNTKFKLGDKEYVIGSTGNLVVDYPPAANALQITSTSYPIGTVYYIYSTPIGNTNNRFDNITGVTTKTTVGDESDLKDRSSFISHIYKAIVTPITGQEATMAINGGKSYPLYRTIELSDIKSLSVNNATVVMYYQYYEVTMLQDKNLLLLLDNNDIQLTIEGGVQE